MLAFHVGAYFLNYRLSDENYLDWEERHLKNKQIRHVGRTGLMLDGSPACVKREAAEILGEDGIQSSAMCYQMKKKELIPSASLGQCMENGYFTAFSIIGHVVRSWSHHGLFNALPEVPDFAIEGQSLSSMRTPWLPPSRRSSWWFGGLACRPSRRTGASLRKMKNHPDPLEKFEEALMGAIKGRFEMDRHPFKEIMLPAGAIPEGLRADQCRRAHRRGAEWCATVTVILSPSMDRTMAQKVAMEARDLQMGTRAAMWRGLADGCRHNWTMQNFRVHPATKKTAVHLARAPEAEADVRGPAMLIWTPRLGARLWKRCSARSTRSRSSPSRTRGSIR